MNTNPIQDRSALRWIGDDLNELLRGVRRDLEAFAEGDGDLAHMSSCRDQLHQIQGTLQMVQVYGGAMLVDEMEKVADAIIDGSISEPSKAAEPLMLGIVQLPNYLERLEAGDPDIPLNLLPALNDLRTVRQQPMVSEMSMYAPKLDGIIAAEPVDPNCGDGNRALQRELRQWRYQFQRALLSWYKEPGVTSHLKPIKEQLDAVFRLARTARLKRLLEATDALVVDIMDAETLPDKDEKLLFGRLDRFFKQIIDFGEEAAVHDFPVDLLRHILYYVSRSESNNPVVRNVRDLAYEANSFFDADAVGTEATAVGANRELYAAVGDALRQDLRALQDDLDLYIRGDRDDLPRLQALSAQLGRIGDTLGVIGGGNLRTRFKARAEQVSDIVRSGIPPEDEPLMEIAGDILHIESALGDLDKPGGSGMHDVAEDEIGLSDLAMREHIASALQEVFSELNKVKDAFGGFLESADDARSLGEVPAQLRQVAGVLTVLGEPQAGALLSNFAPYCDDLANGVRGLPNDQEQEAVADIVTGVEFYLHALLENRGTRQEMLNHARSAGKALGLVIPSEQPRADTPQIELVAAARTNLRLSDDGAAAAESLTLIEGEPPVSDLAARTELPGSTAPSEVSPAAEQPTEPTLTLIGGGKPDMTMELVHEGALEGGAGSAGVNKDVPSEASDGGNLAKAPLKETKDFEFTPETNEEVATDELRDGLQSAGVTCEAGTAALEVDEKKDQQIADVQACADAALAGSDPEPQGAVALLEDIDEEILEVFLEEAREELDTIQEQYPRWRADINDQEALQTFRRSFHTLKGSGRLVGASTIGEFAWSMENLLNRVIDNTVAVDERLIGVLDEACGLLPALVHALDGEGVADVAAVRRVASRADGLADPRLATAEPSNKAFEQSADVSVAATEQPDESTPFHTEMGDAGTIEGVEAILATAATDEVGAETDERGGRFDEEVPFDLEPNAGDIATVALASNVASESSEVTADRLAQAGDTSELELADLDETGGAADLELTLEPAPAEKAVPAPARNAGSQVKEFDASQLEQADVAERPPDQRMPVEVAPDESRREAGPAADLAGASLEPLEVDAPSPVDTKGAPDFMDEIVLEMPSVFASSSGVASTEALTDPTIEQPAAAPESAAREDADASRPFLGSHQQSVEEETAADGEVELSGVSIELDSTLHEVFRSEAQALFDKLAGFLDRAREAAEPLAFDQDFERAWHTLHGSARMAGVDPVAELAKALERYVNVQRQLGCMADAESVALLTRGETLCQSIIETINTDGAALPAWQALCEQVMRSTVALQSGAKEAASPEDALAGGAESALDPELLEIFLEEARELNECLETEVQAWIEMPQERAPVVVLQRTLHTLKGGARLAGIASLGDLCHALESLFEAVVDGNLEVSEQLLNVVQRSVDYLASAVESLHESGQLPETTALTVQVEAALRGEFPESGLLIPDSADLTEGAADAGLDSVSSEVDLAASLNAEDAGLDPDLLEIFLEEARELSEGMETQFQAWTVAPQELAPVSELQRILHTFKGGARLAGLSTLGDLSHALESLFEAVVGGVLVTSQPLLTVVRQGVDFLAEAIEVLPSGTHMPDTRAIVVRIEAALKGDFVGSMKLTADLAAQDLGEPAPEMDQELAIAADETEDSKLILDSELLSDSRFVDSALSEFAEPGQVIPFSPRGQDGSAVAPRPRPPDETKRNQKRRAERVRVSADLLDQLVNSAGEVSIYRARLDQQNNTLDFNLKELDQTVTRLREQLRKLEIETEIQILSHHESEKDLDFDPLELDRYSAIQELSRALSETVSDLTSIGGTLADLNTDTETLLLQHARVSNELQDGLLRTRMVPFGSRVSRFQRIVRQTGDSLGKPVELEVAEARGEIDRSILERVMAPLEHLLRNAVAHGIEGPEARVASGKSEIGHISLKVQREGTEIVIAVADDGAGLDREAIRAKAIDRGLLDPNKSVNDSDLDAYILAPGFSTSKQVNQIAGRGVGMDVVQSEVKQLGGTLDVASEPGTGARFTIRLPYTLAITEGLLIQQGDEVFAAPHGTIDGVIRIARDDLEACYMGKREAIDYAGISYRVRYLGNMLGSGQPELVEGQKWFPVLLARGGEHRVAVHVDAVVGNRQVVVKSVGPQLVQARAFTGATILADGKVALILDINNLVRMDAAQQVAPVALPIESEAAKSVTVMVVDDSITVRKVTSRLLERHNMGVVTAKDGVDAVTKLQDVRPDVMLLDIEMPRMDGYELARHIQNSPDLQGLPIVMITSRTGDKHRQRAMELGVRHYLGKPYQESDLLEHIYDVLAEQVSE